MNRPADRSPAPAAAGEPVLDPATSAQRDFAVTITVIDGRLILSIVTVNEDGPGYVIRPLAPPRGE